MRDGKDARIKIGFVVLGTTALDATEARAMVEASTGAIRSLDADVVSAGDVVTTREEQGAASRALKEGGVDMMIVQIGTWTPDFLAIAMVKDVDVPLLLWAVPEELRGGFPVGRLVGLTQVGGVLSKLGKRFRVIYGNPDDPNVLRQIDRTARAVKAARLLAQTKVGLLGYGCPGMSDTMFHELELRNAIGPEVIRIDLSELVSRSQGLGGDERMRAALSEMAAIGMSSEPADANKEEAARTYLALTDLVRENDLDGLAVRCWPELRRLGIASPCFAMSLLSDKGVMTSCEGDLTAAVSMLILHYLTGSPAYLGDLLAIDEAENTMSFFHCGAAASGLAEDRTKVELRLHAEEESSVSTWKKGVTVEFSLKPGRVTFARLGERRGRYRLIIMGGEALPTYMFVRGNTAKVRADSGVRHVLQRVIAEGHEHHYVLCHGDVREELIELCELLGIEPVVI
jgi:L-fucose isomerase-like protein